MKLGRLEEASELKCGLESVEDVGWELEERVLVRDLLLQLKEWLLVTDFRMLS